MDKSTAIGKVPLVLITGFLGSGKTSLLRQILKNISVSKKVAIIQNEFAPGRVDSAELESTGKKFSLLEINNGSVFCACLLDDFVDRLGDFISLYQPEIIFLEATGLADPVSMSQIMQAEEVKDQIYLGGIWTVIDCLNFNRSHRFIQRVKHQVQLADLILLNKTDIRTPDSSLKDQIRAWNPHAIQVTSIKGLFDNIDEYLDRLELNETSLYKSSDREEKYSMPRPDIGSCVIRTQKIYTEQSVRIFYNNYSDSIYRMKGFFKGPDGSSYLVQGVFEKLDIEPFENWKGPTEIIIMGPGIQPGPVSRDFLNIGRNAKSYN